jgi:ParB family chromosome partitioning protein
MSKHDEIMSRFGGNLAESMGAGRASRPSGLPGAIPPQPASRHDGTTRLKSGAEIAVDRIAPDPDQPRTEFEPDAIGRLAESLKTHGQIQPITVRWSESMGMYLIVSGERRWRASRLAGRTTMSAVILDGEHDPSRILEIQLVENCLREDLAPIERARAFKTLMDRNAWTGATLADALHIDPSSVTRAVALLDLPCTVQEAVASGTLSPSVAYEIGKASTPEAQSEVAALAVSGGLNRAEVVEAVRRSRPSSSKGRGGKAKPRKTSATIRAGNGAKVTVEHRRGVDDAVMVAALADILAQLEGRAVGRDQAA